VAKAAVDYQKLHSQHTVFPKFTAKIRFAMQVGARQLIQSVRVVGDAVRVRWADRHVSQFHHLWLRDHCPSRYHPSSGQRMVPLSSIPLDVAPSRLAVRGGAGAEQTLEITWPASDAPGTSSAARTSAALAVSSFDASWLRTHCYSEGARLERASSGDAAAEGGLLPRVSAWGPETFAEAALPRVDWHSAIGAEDSTRPGAERARAAAALRTLELLQTYGFVLVDGVAGGVEATRELAEAVGTSLPTLYGDIWDTGGELLLGYQSIYPSIHLSIYLYLELPNQLPI